MNPIYKKISLKSSAFITQSYSTSFSHGVRLLHRNIQLPIHAIYGFVRLADEIVDTFHDQDQAQLLDEYRTATYKAMERGHSINPVLNSFQWVVNKYGIDREFIDSFLNSMEMDLEQKSHDQLSYASYILGSAEVVGLMCLRVFCNNDSKQFDELKPHAMSLGSAFQKVNFLRDIKEDVEELGRVYFPGISFDDFNANVKSQIEEEILREFDHAFIGIQKLPASSKLGVYTAYMYYKTLLKKIMRSNAHELFSRRIRVSNAQKLVLMLQSRTRFELGML
jgi:phytoene synthase